MSILKTNIPVGLASDHAGYDMKQFDSSVEGITNKIVVTMFVNVIPTE